MFIYFLNINNQIYIYNIYIVIILNWQNFLTTRNKVSFCAYYSRPDLSPN